MTGSVCEQCGFEALDGLPPATVARRVRAAVPGFEARLARPGAAVRPTPAVWSVIEYAAHVRDLCRLAPARLATMLSFDDPEFANWDENAAAADGAYAGLDPSAVGAELAAWASVAAAAFDAVPADALGRTARRSDDRRFTVTTFGAQFLHEVEHHLHDVGGVPEDGPGGLGGADGDGAGGVGGDADRAGIAAVVDTFFAAFTSGPDLDERMAELRGLFTPDAVIVRTCGQEHAHYDVDGFIAPRRALLAGGGVAEFREWAIEGRTDVFGDVAQHWCSYGKSWVQDGELMSGRGMKTLQLLRTGEGWRIVAASWDDERPGVPLQRIL